MDRFVQSSHHSGGTLPLIDRSNQHSCVQQCPEGQTGTAERGEGERVVIKSVLFSPILSHKRCRPPPPPPISKLLRGPCQTKVLNQVDRIINLPRSTQHRSCEKTVQSSSTPERGGGSGSSGKHNHPKRTPVMRHTYRERQRDGHTSSHVYIYRP